MRDPLLPTFGSAVDASTWSRRCAAALGIFLAVGVAACLRRPAPPLAALTVPGAAAEPPQTVEGYDRSSWPDRFPDATWLPFVSPPMASGIVVEISVNDARVSGQLDTGATSSIIGRPLAEQLGITNRATYEGQVRISAHGRVTDAEAYRADITLGGFAVLDTVVNVVEQDLPDVIVGRAVLAAVDLLLAVDERVVGVFPAGAGPELEGAGVLSYVRYPDGVSYVSSFVLDPRDDRYRGPISTLIDTGAASSSLPARFLEGYPAVSTLEATTIAGRHVAVYHAASDFVVGRRHLPVGDVYPWASSARHGLLGLDVLRRFDVLVSAVRGRIWLRPADRRPPVRMRGPDGERCSRGEGEAPCLSVWMSADDDAPALCAALGPVWAGRPLALRVGAEHQDGTAAWGGALMTLWVRGGPGWSEVCRPVPIRPHQEPVWSFARLSLEAVWAPRPFPCAERAACLSTSGALPPP